jgi:hypothetical protein
MSEHTYSPSAWSRVPGVDTSGADAHRHPSWLSGVQSVVPEPVFPEAEASEAADEVLEAAPVKPEPARKPAPEPAADGYFARAYVRKD